MNDKALEIYEHLIERYPDSELTKQVKVKLDALKGAKKEEERKKQLEAAAQIASQAAKEDTTILKIEELDSQTTPSTFNTRIWF